MTLNIKRSGYYETDRDWSLDFWRIVRSKEGHHYEETVVEVDMSTHLILGLILIDYISVEGYRVRESSQEPNSSTGVRDQIQKFLSLAKNWAHERQPIRIGENVKCLSSCHRCQLENIIQDHLLSEVRND